MAWNHFKIGRIHSNSKKKVNASPGKFLKIFKNCLNLNAEEKVSRIHGQKI
jgi:hypothetical protein